MRTANVSRQSFAPFARPESNLVRAARKAIDTWVLWQRRADDRRRLREMSGHLWRDIGIDQMSLDEEANKPFWRA